MKKYIITFALIIVLAVCSMNVFADEETPNLINALNSSFEGTNSVESTVWFTLTDSFGDSQKRNTNKLIVKSGKAYEGENYLAFEGGQSWNSASINLYPFFKEAGPGEYLIIMRIRIDKTPKKFYIRCLSTDVDEERIDQFPCVTARGSGNYYATHNLISTPDAEWTQLMSDPIEITEEAIRDEHHNWWFCFGDLEANKGFDLDAFQIIPASEYEDPNILPDTELNYLDAETKENIISVATPYKDATPAPDDTQEKATPTPIIQDGKTVDLTLWIAIGAFVVTAGASLAVVVVVRKKKK